MVTRSRMRTWCYFSETKSYKRPFLPCRILSVSRFINHPGMNILWCLIVAVCIFKTHFSSSMLLTVPEMLTSPESPLLLSSTILEISNFSLSSLSQFPLGGSIDLIFGDFCIHSDSPMMLSLWDHGSSSIVHSPLSLLPLGPCKSPDTFQIRASCQNAPPKFSEFDWHNS